MIRWGGEFRSLARISYGFLAEMRTEHEGLRDILSSIQLHHFHTSSTRYSTSSQVPVLVVARSEMLKNLVEFTPALGESTDRQTELEIILLHSISRV